jgi:hypothetical protein
MTITEQIQHELQTLPDEAQAQLLAFLQALKQHYATPQSSISTYDNLCASGLIGCVDLETDLSSTYKTTLTQELNAKYDHH